MQIIVSSVTFQSIIKKAFDNETHRFSINGGSGEITFQGIGYVSFPVTPVPRYSEVSFNADFKEKPWRKLCEFLHKLEDQPVVLEFLYDEIRLTQLVVIFK